MKLEEVLPEFRKGSRIKRHGFINSMGIYEYGTMSLEDALADDWEVIRTPFMGRERCSLEKIKADYGSLASEFAIPNNTSPETRFKITVEEIIKEKV